MPTLHNDVFDNGLSVLDTAANALHICTQEPTTYTQAVTTYSIGVKTSPTISAPADRGAGGREVIVSAITDGAATADGTPTHWALVDTATSRLLATQAVGAGQVFTNGNTFTVQSFTIGIPDPA